MTTVAPEVYEFGSSLSVAQVEELLDRLEADGGAPRQWHLDLAATKHVQPLAAPRLAAALRAMAGHSLTVTLPDAEVPGARFRVLHRTGLVAAIAAQAETVEGAPDDGLARLREDPYDSAATTSSVLFNRIDDGALILHKDRFAARLWSAVARTLGSVDRGLAAVTRRALVEGGYEGVANVVDHAYAHPWKGSDRRAAFCSLSLQKEFSADPKDPLGLAAYREQALAQLETEGLRWFVMSIVDDGVGIAARHALNPDIYDGPVADEESALAEALEHGASIKVAAGDAQVRGDPGEGLSLIASALRDAGGYGCIRTGRHLVELDAFGVTANWTLRHELLAPLRGTVLQIVLPIEDPQQRLPVG